MNSRQLIKPVKSEKRFSDGALVPQIHKCILMWCIQTYKCNVYICMMILKGYFYSLGSFYVCSSDTGPYYHHKNGKLCSTPPSTTFWLPFALSLSSDMYDYWQQVDWKNGNIFWQKIGKMENTEWQHSFFFAPLIFEEKIGNRRKEGGGDKVVICLLCFPDMHTQSRILWMI